MEVFDGRNEKIRLIIFALSILWFIFGIVCMINGGQNHGIIGRTEEAYHLSDLQLAGFAISLIPIGSLMIFMSFFGCCAAIKGSRRMTFTYLTVLFILAFIKMIIACVLFSRFSAKHIKETVDRNLGEVLNKTEIAEVTDRYKNATFYGNVTVFAKAVHDIHMNHGCCGINGSHFYETGKIPHSCCVDADEAQLSKFHMCGDEDEKYEEGCSHEVVKVITQAKSELANFLIGFSIIELIICAFEFSITKNIKDI